MNKKILFLIMMILTGFFSCYDALDTYDKTVVYKLRDRGPAGGWIFYINPNWETDGWRYLEAAPADVNSGASITWSSVTATSIGTTKTKVGTGFSNTSLIIAQSGHTSSAAKACRDYRGGGYSDWFFPSQDELDLMCWNLRGKRHPTNPLWVTNDNTDVPNVSGGGVGAFGSNTYYCSSEVNANSAYYQGFSNGYWGTANPKANALNVRAIRAF